MGVCCSKRRESSSPAAKVPSNDPPKERSIVKEENESSDAAEFVNGATSLTKKASCIAEVKDKKTGETPVKQSAQLEEEKGSKATATVSTHLKTSSCTKEEVDAILIQCGRLSRNSSGKTSNEMAGQKRPSGSKKSYDFDNDGKEEGEAFDKSTSRPSPRRKTRSGSRERGSSEGRRLSRSPGRRSDGPASSACDKTRQQPAKMISVPATEKGSFFVNGDTDGGSSDGKRVSTPQSTRSRSPANNTMMSNENARSLSLSRSCSRKADESPSRRNPMAEIDENSLRNHNGANISSILQSSKKVDDKVIQSQIVHAKKAEKLEDAKLNTGVEILNPSALTKTRSSRRTSRDFDYNAVLKPPFYSSFMLEDMQKDQNHQQNTAVSYPTFVYKASSCSEQRSNETNQSNNIFLKNELASRVSMVPGETLNESELEVQNDIKKQTIHKYVTARDVVPQESAGSNSYVEEHWGSSWDLNSPDSTDLCCTSLPSNGKDVEVENEVSQKGNQQQKISWQGPIGGQRSKASSQGNGHTTVRLVEPNAMDPRSF